MVPSKYLWGDFSGRLSRQGRYLIPVDGLDMLSRDSATTVGATTMKRQEREELERRVQELERRDPKASASAIERQLGEVVPIAYGSWKEDTPVLRSRLRAIQRWRSGARGRDAGRGSATCSRTSGRSGTDSGKRSIRPTRSPRSWPPGPGASSSTTAARRSSGTSGSPWTTWTSTTPLRS